MELLKRWTRSRRRKRTEKNGPKPDMRTTLLSLQGAYERKRPTDDSPPASSEPAAPEKPTH